MALFLAGLFGVFLSLFGFAFVVDPAGMVPIFGIDPSHMAALPLVPGFGVRQLVIGLAVLALAIRRQALACGIVLLIGTLLPFADYAIAGNMLGHTQAIRHLALAPIYFILGLWLMGKGSGNVKTIE